MKTFLTLSILLTSVTLWAVDDLAKPDFVPRFYHLQDNQYFKPLLADIRTPRFHMRGYRSRGLRFANSTTASEHTFWDVTFGTYFPFIGWNIPRQASDNPMEMTGLALFIQGSAHMLLDFDTKSSDVMNTDFRIGGGVVTRFPGIWKNFALRMQFFHESTHIGDEFTLGNEANPDFHRYNVSYEAFEAFLAVDKFLPEAEFGYFSYFRAYVGTRWIYQTEFNDFIELAPPLLRSDQNEIQFGLESFVRLWASPFEAARENDSWYAKFVLPQYFILAVEGFRDDKYDLVQPQSAWGTHIVLGVVYGQYFQRKRTVRWTLNYYNGVNPHGQFRTDNIKDLGLNYSIIF